MTEQDWLESDDPQKLLTFLIETANRRKLTLFVCSCCRRVWQLLTDKRSRIAVEAAERFADNLASEEELSIAEYHAEAACFRFEAIAERRELDHRLIELGCMEGAEAFEFVHELGDPETPFKFTLDELRSAAHLADMAVCDPQSFIHFAEWSLLPTNLLRDIFGNPFRPVTLDPRWLSSTVLDRVRTIYDERVPERMPILADALMDAGCDSEEIISHCRSDGPHVRGCWVVDLLLAKS